MARHWFPQRNNADSVVALLKNLIFHIQFRVSKLTIEKEVEAYPGFPFLSFGDISQILKRWGLLSVAFDCGMSDLNDIPTPSVLYLNEKEGDVKTGVFVLFFSIKGNMVEYLHTRKGWVLEHMDVFEKKWAKAALSLTEAVSEGEPHFERNEAEYNKKWEGNPELRHVKVMDNFLTASECDYMIELSKTKFQPSKLMSDKNIVGYGRNSFSAELHGCADDIILKGIQQKAAKLVSLPENHVEYFQCLYYDPGQEYQNHFDTFDESTDSGKALVAQKGQRKYTILAYLNDDFEGGGTHFPNLDLLVQPKKGRVVIFDNLDENGQVLKAAFHAGMPVTTGRKYAMNIWIRNKPCRD